jgi:hypothetical protein
MGGRPIRPLRNIGTESHGFGIRVLAAIGFCPLTAMSGRPETASFVTERDREPGVGRAGTVVLRGSTISVCQPAPAQIRPYVPGQMAAGVYRI